jgi:FlaA1/EpsC-like NDP-sugar epimerase
MERSENALFEIDRQIAARFPNLRRKAVLHDIADAEATRRVFNELKPDVVFHAAAHKHVPLMEDHPAHAVTNNLFGTKSVADAAIAAGTQRFVLISSDKAVNPTSVMGATKRLAEMYIQAMHRQCREHGDATRFSMVRFGNVLGSACSVLPIWSAQIAEGGPITVTDPRMTRYFMTIHEAASLVIQAGVLQPDSATAGVFVLDMGEPVNILELAQRFVRQHGMEPLVVNTNGPRSSDVAASAEHDLDTPADALIQIKITGARPGEKLHEELAYAAEQLRPSSHPGINVWAGKVGGSLGDQFNLTQLLADLSAVQSSYDREAVIAAIRKHVPEMVVPLKLRSGPSRGGFELPMDTPTTGDGLGLAA